MACLSPYDPEWPRIYETEATAVADALQPVIQVEHVGSTSVPGLAAKPTIDIAVAVTSLALGARAYERMGLLGYHYGGSHGQPQHVFRKGEAVPWRALVHVVEYEGQMWQDFVAFRDYLRRHPADAERYAQLKASLLAGRDGWYSGRDKEAFIRPVLDSFRS